METHAITRSIRIDAAADAVWASVGDADGLTGWLGSTVEVDLAAGAAGTLVDHAGTSRRLVITEVTEGRRVGFVWWDDDRPDDASHVVIAVDADGAGTRVTVTETSDRVSVASFGRGANTLAMTEVADLTEVGLRWDARLSQLLGLVSATLVVVGA